MAEKYNHQQQAQGYPLAPAAVMPRSDEEYAATNHRSQEQLLKLKKKNRMKCLAYIATFAVFQAVIILIFALIFMRLRTVRVRLDDVALTGDATGSNLRLTARVSVRNRNFGRYKFDSGVATVTSGGINVGQFVIPEGRAGARSTKRVHVIAILNGLNATSSGAGVALINVEARLRGKVRFLRVIRRRKSADMKCSMTVSLPGNAVQGLRCE